MLTSGLPPIDPAFGPSISNSEIATFKECRRKWWLTYYLGMKPREREYVGALSLGSRVHAALEEHVRWGRDLMEAHAELVATDRMRMEAEGLDPEDLNDDAELGRIMLEGYLEWVAEEGLDANLEVISVEEVLRMTTTVPEGIVTLIGKIDQRVRNLFDGTRMVLDFKTSMNFAEFDNTSHTNEQLPTYMTLDHVNNDDPSERISGGVYRMLRKVKRGPQAKPPFYREITVRHNTFAMRSFWKRLHGTLNEMLRLRKALDRGMDHREVAYPTPTRDCRWKCKFYPICPLFDDGSGAEDALKDSYEIGDPYAYYEDRPETPSE